MHAREHYISAGQHVKFLCSQGMLLVGHQLRQVAAPACTYCQSCSDATLPLTYAAALQQLLLCSAFSALQAAFILAVHAMGVLGKATVAQLRELPADH